MGYQIHDVTRLHLRDTVFQLKYIRQRLIGGRKSNQPLVLCNSYPKSGTHLLYQILYSLPNLQKWDDIVSVQALCGIMNTANHLRWKIGSAPNGSIVRSHLMYCQEILDILQERNCKILFIYRDLRDVAVSHARWVTKEPRIFLHPIYLKMADFDQQLMSSIKGVPIGSPFSSNVSQPNIGQDFLRWKGWINNPSILAVKFEDLVGERGGASEEKRLYMVEKIADFLEISLSSESVKNRFSSQTMNPQDSHTFVKGGKGKKGNWKEFFSSSHKQEFKKVAGELLIELGYEKNIEW